MVDPQGHAVTLKGVNLGNWLVNEFWMLGLSGLPGTPKDQYDLEKLLAERFGESEKDRLMDLYRSSWITERDFKLMPTFGFNFVRLPMNYRLMEDDRTPFHLKPNAWKWIDRAVDLSERHGLYVILDMHGAQGGQSPYDHTGRSDQNHLKDNVEDQKRLAWLWGEIAKRYRNRGAVMAYDVMNEPYGTPKPIQVDVFKRALAEIRKNDPEKLVFAHGNYDDFDHYGDPKANGWHNVGFQMHFYPGLFGGGRPTVATHMKHLASLAGWDAKVKKLNVPFLIGEMNVVFDAAGGAQMMRRYYETHAAYGWMTSMWAWKTVSKEGGIHPANWGAVVNQEPMRTINFAADSKAAIEEYFERFASEPLAVNEALRRELTSKEPLPPLPPTPPVRTTAPQESLEGWTATDVGKPLTGGLKLLGSGAFELYGGGSDIWGTKDQFRFLNQAIEGDFEIQVVVDGVEDLEDYTKAGLTIRSGRDSDAQFAMITTFPNAEVQFAYRDTEPGEAQGLTAKAATLPNLRLRLVRKGGKIEGFFAKGAGEWISAGSTADHLPRKVYVGAIALSHDNSQLVKITYRDLRIMKP
ncbi:glycoside hydrolase family protein [Fimbriimonas ginsengisoli Gsoil 348]|uniref:Glycoside hydrolase family protein n=2 Tax=Fimbriimonas ginsengisoli TaxID=1005039 RepID=A0A068NSE0_FIMGI|nr:glycoside hydrolase family protein [Fimbriimonas ginsengisoli Gsoil 348]